VPGIPLVSYILVNWRTEDLLPRALASITAQTHKLREVWVVDNGSLDFDPAALLACPGAQCIRNDANLGFAVANNQALERCQGDVIILLNCDAYLDPEFTARALAVLDANERIGTVVPKILRDDGSGQLDSTGHVMYTDRTPSLRGRGELDQGQYNRGGFVFGGTAAAICYRRELLAEIASSPGRGVDQPLGEVFDAGFFAYYEDVDVDWRAQRAGWLAYYEPRCLAYHRGHGSGGRKDIAIQRKAEKNRYLMIAKNDTLAAQLPHLGPLLLYEVWHLAKTLLKPALWPAYITLLACLPRALYYKRRCAHARRVSAAEVAARWFTARGYQPPPKAEPPALQATPLLESAAEQMATDRALDNELFPLVSVVVVNFNGLHLTKACVMALRAQSYAQLEIIVVDNGSELDEADLLKTDFPAVRMLRLEQNQGFSGGANWGMSIARGEYIVLVNNDSLPDQDCVKRLVHAARRTGAAAVSGRLVDVPTTDTATEALQAVDASFSGEDYPPGMSLAVADALFEARRNHGLSLFGFIVKDAYPGQAACFYPSGGLCVLTREAVDALGPEVFPHFYFAYHEDAYLGFRLRARGYAVAKEPRAVAVHLAGSTARKLGRPRLRFYQERNRGLNLLAWLPTSVLWRLGPMRLLVELGTGLALLVRPGDWLGWLAAHIWGWACLPRVLRWRAKCQAERAVPDAAWLSELSGQVRGAGGMLNRLSLAWCKARGIPCREHSKQDISR
jgi:GT2 family glycosyltransferase